MKRLTWLAILLSLISFGATAKKLYKYQAKDGTWHFTDTAPETEEPVAVRQLKVAPKQMVWLVQSGEERHPNYVIRNDYSGPVEVEVNFADRQNADANPKLPARFIVPPGNSDPLFAIGALDESQAWEYTLRFRYALGVPMTEYRSDEGYYPPISPEASFQITQGFGGAFSHHDEQNQYAVDIAMPEGTPIHAARSGVVMDVENDYFKGGVNKAYSNEANNIRILHADGSMAVYAHLELEKAQVHPGLEVTAGQLIGYSGNTGFSSGPHLHFAVQYNQGMKLVSTPFVFVDSEGKAEVPVEGAWLKGVIP